MNSLLVIIIILIILAILYLYFRNVQFNNMLESFDNNNTQNSLSTFFQNTVDYDYYQTYNNKYNYAFKKQKTVSNNPHTKKIITAPKVINAEWDGIWTDGFNFHAQFIQKNDEVMIGFSNSSFDNLFLKLFNGDNSNGNNPLNTTNPNSNNPYTDPYYNCPENVFIGVGKLTKDRTVFLLKEIMCNFYINDNLTLKVDNLTGKINGKTITLYSQDKSPITLTLVKPFGNKTLSNMNLFKNNYAPLTTLFPEIITSEYVYEEDWCSTSGGSPCKFQSDGISDTTYTNDSFNACGTPGKNNVCTGKPNCVIYSPAPPGYTSCKHNVNIHDYMNYYTIKALSHINGNNVKVCDYLKYFNSDKCNSVIICYITNVGDVLTLNYEYHGKLPGQSSLTVQRDVMHSVLNTSSILPAYRNILTNNNYNSSKALDAISFTNCLENNNNGGTNLNRLSQSIIPAGILAKKYELDNSYKYNDKLAPAVWQLNNNGTSTNYNTQDSCPIIMSTSQNYSTPVRYTEFYDNGTTGLTSHKGGVNKQLFLENINIINKNDSSIVLTANIRVNNRLYLIPDKSTKGFSNNSITVNLDDEPEENGKWLILGFTINTLGDLNNIIKNIPSYFLQKYIY